MSIEVLELNPFEKQQAGNKALATAKATSEAVAAARREAANAAKAATAAAAASGMSAEETAAAVKAAVQDTLTAASNAIKAKRAEIKSMSSGQLKDQAVAEGKGKAAQSSAAAPGAAAGASGSPPAWKTYAMIGGGVLALGAIVFVLKRKPVQS